MKQPKALITALVLMSVALVLAIAAVVVLVVNDSDEPPSAPTGPSSYADAGQIVTALASTGLTENCSAENGLPPVISQQRCTVPGQGEMIVMVLPDASAVEARVAFLSGIGGSGLVRGPNWLVNVGDLSVRDQQAVSDALRGTLLRSTP